MPKIEFYLPIMIEESLEDVLLFLNRDRTEDSKYVDIQSWMRERLRDYINKAYPPFLTWKLTKRVGSNSDVELELIKFEGMEKTSLPKEHKSDKKIVLVVGNFMKKRLIDLLPWENAIQLTIARSSIKYVNVAHFVRNYLSMELVTLIGQVETLLLEEEEESLKEETTQ